MCKPNTSNANHLSMTACTLNQTNNLPTSYRINCWLKFNNQTIYRHAELPSVQGQKKSLRYGHYIESYLIFSDACKFSVLMNIVFYCLISRLLWYSLYIVLSPPGSKTFVLSKTTINMRCLYTSNICSPLSVTPYSSCLLVP